MNLLEDFYEKGTPDMKYYAFDINYCQQVNNT